MMVFVTHTSGMVYDFWVVTWTGTSISLRFECVAMNGIIINKAAAAKKCRVSEIGHTVATSLALGGTKAIRSAYEPFGGQPSADVSTIYERGPPHLYKSRF